MIADEMNSHFGSVSIEVVEGHTERRILVVVPLRQALQPNSRHRVRGSSRRITTMTAALRPIREYQCDQPSSLALRPLHLFQEKDNQKN